MARIVVCDDAEFMRMTVKDMLEAGGHEVVGEAEGVDEVVELYKLLKPDLVTLDILMKKSGVEAVERIMLDDPNAKIVMVSVLNDQEGEVVEAIRRGALGMVSKPIKKETLLSEVNRVLGK